ncbi:MAG: DASH family cryptochrome [Rubripirellula sp.]
MTTNVVWFRNDLRVADHAPLLEACKRANDLGEKVFPVFIFDPEWFGKTAFGFPRVSRSRGRFLLESINDLSRQLERLGGKLHLLMGETASVLADLCEKAGVRSVLCHHEVASEEVKIEEAARRLLADLAVDLVAFPATTMVDWTNLPFEVSETPEVFTKFRRLVEKRGVFSAPLPPPKSVDSSVEAITGEVTISEIQAMDWFPDCAVESEDEKAGFYRGGVDAGELRLQHYLWDTDALSRYKETRNGMLELDDSSKLSAWLAFGCLSAKQVMSEVDRYEIKRVKNDSTYWLKFELLWRDFFLFMSAKHGSKLYHSGGLQSREIPWNQDDGHFDAWKFGRTGYPLVDANMRELFQTGYMSNRGRQNVASFLTKNLGLDWRLGAEWFESRLIDHDPSLNYGNWNYAAGIGNDAREYRWFNINKQAAAYDSDGKYVRHWLPELRHVSTEWIHRPWAMSQSLQESSRCVIGVDYPEPIVDLFHSAEVNKKRYAVASGSRQSHAQQELLNF